MWPRRRTTTPTSKDDTGERLGFRSGLEEKIAAQLALAGIPVVYESKAPVREGGCRLTYEVPTRDAVYTADFMLPNGVIVESKGRFVTEDRKKHKLIKAQHPDLDIRFVFSNPNTRISKTSQTTYAAWCETHGFQYAKGLIPVAWLKEPKKS